jgi:ubiquitin-protein ligase
MSRVHTGELSALAKKRLQKEADSWKNGSGDSTLTSHGTISASPHCSKGENGEEVEDLSRWCANVTLCDGNYTDVNFHIYIEVPSDYPVAPPSAYFRSAICYQNGAQYDVEGKGISICLNLLGNFAFVHTEWASSGEASGWSPSYTISTILITLQGALPDMISSSGAAVVSSRQSSRSCKCLCGHDGSNRLHYFPSLGCYDTKKPAAAAKKDAADSLILKELLGDVSSTSSLISTTTSTSSSSAISVETLQRLSSVSRETLEQIIVSHLSEDVLRQALSLSSLLEASMKDGSAELMVEEDPSLPLDHIVCYATGCTPVSDPTEIFGFGIRVDTAGLLETPAEFLTYSAYDGGVKRSTTNQNLDFFLPVFISLSHWRDTGAFDLFKQSIATIFAHTTKLRKDQYPSAPTQGVLILCSLMNATCLSAEKAGSSAATANDRFINGYFTLLRLLKGLANSIPGVREYIEKKISTFLRYENARNKHPVYGCPNLGEFLLFLHISKRFSWREISRTFAEESQIRRVRWYLMDYPSFANTKKSWLNLSEITFTETETSRRLIAFQVKFLLIAKSVSLNTFVDGAVPDYLLQQLKNLHHEISKKVIDWNSYNTFLDLPSNKSKTEIHEEINKAIDLSETRGYHKRYHYLNSDGSVKQRHDSYPNQRHNDYDDWENWNKGDGGW